jgi:hypothetical protein
MRRVGLGELPKDLVQVRGQFEAWRRQRRVGERIPQALWALAVRLANRHGIKRTSAALGVDYYSLKKQTERAAGKMQASSGPTFVELPAALALGNTVGKRCLLELDRGTGASLRLHLVGYDTTDVATLAHAFWSVR